MLSIGGVIGTGLFLGAGLTVNGAGPLGAIIAYLVGGLMTYLVMVSLGEMAVVMPVTGSFQDYSAKFIGPGTGFVVGLMYWMSWATTVGLEFTAAGMIMKRWFPHTPIWIWCVIFIALLFSLNILTTKGFAETEFWFAGIKVAAVVLFIVVGALAMFGVIGSGKGPAPYFTNLYSDGGLFPHGLSAVFIAMMTVVYAFQGTELMGIAAGESENPERDIPKAVRNIIVRILFFYILSIVVLSALIPWREANLVESPFVAIFEKVGIPYAADIMNFVILTALLSVGNSGLYVCSRMLFSLSRSGQVHPAFGKLTKRGIPFNALLISLGFALLSLLTSVLAADTLFVILLAISGTGTTIAWMSISFSHLKFRKQFMKENGNLHELKYKVRLFPLIPILSLILCMGIILSLVFDPAQRSSLYWTFGFMAACYLYHYVRLRKSKKTDPPLPAPGSKMNA